MKHPLNGRPARLGLCLSFALLSGCAVLTPRPLPPRTALPAQRQRAYAAAAVDVVPLGPHEFPRNLGLPDIGGALSPRLRCQGQDLGPFGSLQLEAYYRSYGAQQAAELERKARRRFWVSESLWGVGTVLVTVGVLHFMDGHRGDFLDWYLSGLAVSGASLWVAYDGTTQYRYPAARSFDDLLKGRLNLSAYPQDRGGGLMASWTY